MRPEGGAPGGGPGGGGFNNDQKLDPEKIVTVQTRRTENGDNASRAFGTLTPLIEPLVKLLQEKVGS